MGDIYLTINKTILVLLISILLVSCNIDWTSTEKLSLAIQLSGENKDELTKVLQHYSVHTKDSLKLKAAKFLIGNMRYHCSASGDYIENHIRNVDSLCSSMPTLIKSSYYIIPTRIDILRSDIHYEPDLHNITADFLIKNIDYSFELWNNGVLRNITFEDFCEYVLPYKAHQEPLILWKDSSLFQYFDVSDIKDYDLDINIYRDYINKLIPSYKLINPNRLIDTLLINYKFDCVDFAFRNLQIFRAMGVPTAVDFVPYFSTTNGRHYWYANIDNSYLNKNCSSYNNLCGMAKVYRKTYSINPFVKDKINFVPTFMNDPHIKDVTNKYVDVIDLKYNFGNIPSYVQYAYLAIFGNLGWKEVAWDKLNKKEAIFKNMGKGVIYMPTYYDKKKQVYGRYPILVKENGITKELIPNKDSLQDIRLKRKYPFSSIGEYYGEKLLKCRFVASNNKFRFKTISSIDTYKNMEYDTLKINDLENYKYWGISLEDNIGNSCDIGEVKFYNKKGEEIKGTPFMINKEGNYRENTECRLLFDDNELTYVTLQSKNIIGIKLEKPEAVSYITYISRNDQNGVYAGDDYELLYFENNKWISFERKFAKNNYIDFYNVPTNALFWLRNHTEGSEERIFIINNNRQIKFY